MPPSFASDSCHGVGNGSHHSAQRPRTRVVRGLEQFAEQDEALEKGGFICERASMDECTGLAVEVLLSAVEHEEEEEKE